MHMTTCTVLFTWPYYSSKDTKQVCHSLTFKNQTLKLDSKEDHQNILIQVMLKYKQPYST